MAANVVEILVKASNLTGAGFAEAKASSKEAATGMEDLAVAQNRVTAAELKLRDAEIQQADAQLRLAELEQSGTAKADELAAAQDKVTAATIRTADAQIRLGEADAKVVAASKVAGDAAVAQGEKASMSSKLAALGGAGFQKFGLLADTALAGAAYESVKMAMSFQQSMERLVTQAGVPQKELGALKSGVLDLAGAVGYSPTSLSTALYHVASNMASMGATVPQMMNAVKIAAEGAKVGGANLEDVTNALGAAIASGIPGVQNYTSAMGMLNATVGAGDMKMQDLAEAMGTGFLANVKLYGTTLNDTGAILATFGDNLIRGSHAGTQLRMSVQSIAVQAKTAGPYLKELGLQAGELGKYQALHGTVATIDMFVSHLKASHVPMDEWGNMVTQIFGKKAGAGIGILVDQMDRLNSKSKILAEGAKGFGAAWANTQKNLSQQWDELRATFDALMVTIGTKLIPMLSAVAGFLLRHKGIIEGLVPDILKMVAAFGALAAIIKVITFVSELDPWVVAIMAVIAVTILLIDHWKEVEHVLADVGGFFVRMGHDIEAAVDATVNFVKAHWKLLIAAILGPIGLIIDALATHWAAVKHGFESAWNFVYNNVIRPVTNLIRGILSPFASWVVNLFRAMWRDAINAATEGAAGVWRVVASLPGRINSALGGLPSMLFNAGVNAIKGLINGIMSMFGAVGNAVSSIASKVAGFFGLSPAREGPLAAGGAPWIRGQHLVQDIAGGMLSQVGTLGQAARNVASKAVPQTGTGAGVGALTGGAGQIVLQFHGGGSGLDALFMTWLKNNVRASGGDPRIFNRKVVLA